MSKALGEPLMAPSLISSRAPPGAAGGGAAAGGTDDEATRGRASSLEGAAGGAGGSSPWGGLRRRIAVCSAAEARASEQRAEKDEAKRLKAQGLPWSLRNRWLKTGNHVATNKYTLLTFLPQALMLQFKEVANVYFAFIAVFYAWERVSPVAGLSRFSGAFSLGVVLFYALVLEAIQDVRRWRQDQSINNASCRALDPTGAEFETRRWRDVGVGDIVKVSADQTFPADLLLLVSDHPDGLAYIETASLDGETNLKVFEAKPKIVAQGVEGVLNEYTTDAEIRKSASVLLQTPDGPAFEAAKEAAVVSRIAGLAQAGATLECELPNASLYEWSGSVSFAGSSGAPEEVAVEAKQLLLRGAVLRKTRWVVGMVVYGEI